MALAIRNLSNLAYAKGFNLWHYRTTDTIAEVGRCGYFKDAKNMFSSGDRIMISAKDGAVDLYVADRSHPMRLIEMVRTEG